MTGKKKSERPRVRKNLLEWVVFGVSLVLVAGVVGHLVYEGVRMEGRPPEVLVRTGEPVERGGAFVVPVTLTNTGDQTAEGVSVEVVLEGADGAEGERGEFAVAFLPRGATREGWVTFTTDPQLGRLRPRVKGYEKP
jgi:uncharacterized protein (TIGR02588 family)